MIRDLEVTESWFVDGFYRGKSDTFTHFERVLR
jgi:hypothetical protein